MPETVLLSSSVLLIGPVAPDLVTCKFRTLVIRIAGRESLIGSSMTVIEANMNFCATCGDGDGYQRYLSWFKVLC